VQRDVDVEVDGKRYQVRLWVPDVAPLEVAGGGAGAAPRASSRPRPGVAAQHGVGAGTGVVSATMQGTIVKVLVAVGDEVEVEQPVCVLEAMKMENNISAQKAGKVAEVRVKAGDTVGAGDVLVVIE
jgi:acetyl-CoA/propionyl-CoA carboxylase biotin carboxyl carrier protein